jgi:hypothetical protein
MASKIYSGFKDLWQRHVQRRLNQLIPIRPTMQAPYRALYLTPSPQATRLPNIPVHRKYPTVTYCPAFAAPNGSRRRQLPTPPQPLTGSCTAAHFAPIRANPEFPTPPSLGERVPCKFRPLGDHSRYTTYQVPLPRGDTGMPPPGFRTPEVF